MKNFFIFCFGIIASTHVFASEKELTEEKLAAMFEKYLTCIKHCQEEKDRITPGYLEYMKKKCNEPFVHLLLELEKAEQKK